jgi:hypothetical protein
VPPSATGRRKTALPKRRKPRLRLPTKKTQWN